MYAGNVKQRLGGCGDGRNGLGVYLRSGIQPGYGGDGRTI